jgi:tRNA-dihydrouridine synthase
MVRNKGRGSGILRTPDVLEKMIEVGCEVMGDGKFSVKARIGVDRNDELLSLIPMLNSYPLRFLTVHPRNARQMYDGECDWNAFNKIAAVAHMPLVKNGDLPFPPLQDENNSEVDGCEFQMIGRGFVRYLGERADVSQLISDYVKASQLELSGSHAVLGRMKELVAYWKELPRWRREWSVIKIARTVEEFLFSIPH